VKHTQADSELEEEHLLDFVVNSSGDELPIDLAENVKVTSDELYEVVAGASAGRRWPFTEFREMVLRAAWTALGVRRAVPANWPLDDRFFR